MLCDSLERLRIQVAICPGRAENLHFEVDGDEFLRRQGTG